MDCINRETPEFKAVEKKYGTELGSKLIRTWTDVNPNKGTPSVSDLRDFLNTDKNNARINLLDALQIDPYINEDIISTILQGIIRKSGDNFYVTRGMTTSEVTNELTYKSIFEPNMTILRKIQKDYPGLIDLKMDDRRKNLVKVSINPNEITTEEAKRRDLKFPDNISESNVKNWLQQKGFIKEDGTVLNEVGLLEIGKREIKDRGLHQQYRGNPFSIHPETSKVFFNSKYFNDIGLKIKNVPRPFPNSMTESQVAEAREMDMIERDIMNEDGFGGIDEFTTEDFSLENPNDVNYSQQTFDRLDGKNELPNEPSNFREWREIRIATLEQLNNNKSSLIKRGAEKKDLEPLTKSIKAIENEIENFDPNDIENVLGHVFNEITELDNILNRQIDGDVESAMELENSNVRSRIMKLRDSFAYIEDMSDTKEFSPTSISFNRGFSQEEIDRVTVKIGRLHEKYEGSLDKILFNVIKNTDHVTDMKNNEDFTQEKYDIFVQRIRDILSGSDLDGVQDPNSWFKSNLYGAKSYGDVLSSLLSTERDVASNTEAGITKDLKRSVNDSWLKIIENRGKTDSNGEYITDKLFQKNEFGQRTSTLVNMYNPAYYSNIGMKGIGEYRKAFFLTPNKTQNYKQWMKFEKSNFDYIDLSKISSFAEKHKDSEDFKGAFIHSSETMSEYEKLMREQMGDTTFEVALETQLEGISNFLSDTFSSDHERHHKNPVKFVNNFYSETFDRSDPTTFDFLVPIKSYVSPIPKLSKSDEFYNNQFKTLENEIGEGFREFYKSSLKLINYTKDAVDSEAALMGQRSNYNFNDILQITEHYRTETARDFGIFGSIYANVRQERKEVGDTFVSASFQNNVIRTLSDMNLNTHLGATGSSLSTNARAAFMGKSHAELVKLAQKEKLTIPDKYLADDLYSKNKLADALVRQVFNKNLTLDPRKGILRGASLAESINTRRKVWGLAQIIEDFNRTRERGEESKFMRVWNQQQLSEEGFLNNAGFISKLERSTLGPLLGKRLGEYDKNIKSLIQERQFENRENPRNFDYDFSFEGFDIRKDSEGGYIKIDRETGKYEPIELSEVSKLYEKYTDNIIDNLGEQRTIGGFMGGMISNFRKAKLSLNPSSGITNREAGYVQNNQLAASGLHGLNTDQLYTARKFLAGARLSNTIEYVPALANVLGLKNKKRVKQWKALENLVDDLKLQENIIDDLDMGSGLILKRGAWKGFLSDFAVNNAEFHNQMELLVAMMMNVKLEVADGDTQMPARDKNGDTITEPFFNKEEMELPFDPDTMKLKSKYRTKNNIRNWEEFEKDNEGRSKHTNLVMNFTVAKHKGHGNYNQGDSMALEGSITGKSLVVFQKWFFENYRNEWGKASINYSTGEINEEGRKRHLLKHPATFVAYMMGQNVLSSNSFVSKSIAVATALWGTAVVLNPIAAGMMVASTVLLPYIAVYGKDSLKFKRNINKIYHNIAARAGVKRKEQLKQAVEESKLAGSFLLEVALRTLKSSMTMGTGRLIGPQLTSEKLKKISGAEKTDKDGNKVLSYSKMNSNLTLKQRRIISESAQQLADKFTMVLKYGVLTYMVKTILLSFIGDDQDEDEKFAKIEEYNKVIYFLINKQKQITSEIETHTDPTAIVDMYQLRIFYESTARDLSDLTSFSDYADGKISMSEFFSKTGRSVSQLSGLPVPVSDLIFNQELKTFTSDRVYTGENSMNPMEKHAVRMGSPEKFLEKDVKTKRSRFHRVLKPILIENLNKALGENKDKLTTEEKEKIARKTIQDIYKIEGLSERYNKVDYEELNGRNWIKMRSKYENVVPKVNMKDIKKSRNKKK